MDLVWLLTIITRIFFLLLLMTIHLSHQDDICPERKNPTGLWNKAATYLDFCNPLDSADDRKNRACSTEMNKYFEKYPETKSDVAEFINFCKANPSYNDITKCKETVTEMEYCCFYISEIQYLIQYYIGPNTYQEIGGSYRMRFIVSNVAKTKNFQDFETNSDCRAELRGSDAVKTTELNIGSDLNTSEVSENISTYIRWYEKTEDDKYCNCVEIFYIPIVFKAKGNWSSSEMDFTNLTIEDYFNEICLEDHKKLSIWHKRHFIEIAKSKSGVSPKTLKFFLRNAEPLVIIGRWYDNMGKRIKNEWSFDEIKEAAFPDSNNFSEDKINLLAVAMRSGFDPNDFKGFLQTTSHLFSKDYDCRKEILNIIMDVSIESVQDDVGGNLYTGYRRNDKFWVKNDKSIFNKHLDLFIGITASKITSADADNIGCPNFITELKKLRDIIYKTTWKPESITRLLEYVKNHNDRVRITDLDQEYMLQFFKFCHETEEKVNKLKILIEKNKPTVKEIIKTWKVADGYDLEFAIYRYYLLKNAGEKGVTFDTDGIRKHLKDKNTILNLMKLVIYPEVEGNTLQAYFKNMIDNYNSLVATNEIAPVQ